jgi:hypothetical protein
MSILNFYLNGTVKKTLGFPPTFSPQRYVGTPSWAGERNGTSPIAHADLPLQQEHAILPINGSGPEVGAAHGKRGYGREYRNRLRPKLLNLGSREAKGAPGHTQRDVARALLGIEDKAINHDACVLAKRQDAIVAKGDLQACVSPGAKPVVHLHGRANDGGGGSNLCLVLDLGDPAHGLSSTRTKGGCEKKEDHKEAYEIPQGALALDEYQQSTTLRRSAQLPAQGFLNQRGKPYAAKSVATMVRRPLANKSGPLANKSA